MTTSNTNRASTFLAGRTTRNADLAASYIDFLKLREHSPDVGDGVDGLQKAIASLPSDSHQVLVRSFEDNQYVVTQQDGLLHGPKTFFDVFRFENEAIVEHWSFAADAGLTNRSGHTQKDGPIQAQFLERTEENKAFTRDYYETFHLRGDRSRNAEFFTGDVMIRHEPGVRDGVGNFLHDVEGLMKNRTIDEIKLLLGSGDLVFIAAQGTHDGEPCAYVDLYRIENRKLVEHWGFPQLIPSQQDSKNNNGFF